jgi:MFS family permease
MQSNAAPARLGFLSQITQFRRSFWMANIIEMLERLAYYGVRVVIPIYIAQADEINGLHFTQTQKGVIFLWWAVVQSLVPMFSGGFADRYGYKKTIAFSLVLYASGYVLMATQTAYLPFLLSCCVLAVGSAIFKPGVQGTIVQSMTKENSSVGWGLFYMVVNIGGFLGPPLAHFLYGYSWPTVFYGCAVIVCLNFFMLFTYKEVPSGSDKSAGVLAVLKTTFRNITRPRLAIFIVIMSGFWLMFMQLFDMLPNFIVDWIDSSEIVAQWGIPSWMTVDTPRGTMITQEWLINANSGLIVLAVVFVSWLVSRMRRLSSIIIGIGLIAAGFTMSGYLCILGICLFSIGEMLSSPKMNDYLGVIAPPGEKGLYMGYANIPLAIGWGYGSLMGGQVYDKMGDKANLAIRYISENFHIAKGMSEQAFSDAISKLGIIPSQVVGLYESSEGVDRTRAMDMLQLLSGKNAAEATNLLWNTYQPYTLWYQFAAIGMASAVGIAIYSHFAKRWEAPDV